MEQNKKKQIFIAIITVTILVILVIGVSFAFFNYTRTGSANTVKVGRIYFNHQEGDSISLENVFPISSEQAETDTVNAKTLSITVVGDTDYDKGIEYAVTLDSVNNTVNNKKVPINLEVSVTGEGLGTEEQNDYYTNRDNYTVSKYKIEYNDKLENGKHILVGYISPNTTKGTIEGINGTINIKAYVDKDKVLISDTYPEGTVTIGGVEYYNGTPTTNKLVLTTEEWNSITGNDALSFKIKVEAREGIWVEDSSTNSCTFDVSTVQVATYDINKEACMNAFGDDEITEQICSGQTVYIGELGGNYNFDRMNNTFFMMSLEQLQEQGIISNIQYITPGVLTNGMKYVNGQYTYDYIGNSWHVALTDKESTDPVTTPLCAKVNNYTITDMSRMFIDSQATSIDLSSFDTSNVTSMIEMFADSQATSLDLSSFNTSNVTNMAAMFNGSKATSLDLSSFNTSNVTNMTGMFSMMWYISSLDLSSFDTSNVMEMVQMFETNNASTIYVSNLWNLNNVENHYEMFSISNVVGPNGTKPYASCGIDNYGYGCSNTTGNPTDATYARIDNPPDSPGYFTYKAAPNS